MKDPIEEAQDHLKALGLHATEDVVINALCFLLKDAIRNEQRRDREEDEENERRHG